MAYDASLAQQVQDVLRSKVPTQAKKMFGGVAFMHRGNMTVGVLQKDLIARIGLEKFEAALRQPGIELFHPAGKPMAGWITVTPQAYRSADELEKWIDMAIDFVKTLPPK